MGQLVQQVFASLLSYKKWNKEVQMIMDPKQLVRTVIVAMRPRNTREKSLPYKSKELKHLRVAVQSLALVTKQEQVEEVLKAKEISTPDNGWKKDIKVVILTQLELLTM